jgi:5-methyltetrahydropteroyltriglutamate--homocysteine methyltransferase
MVRGNERLLPTTHVGSYPRPIFMEGLVFNAGVHEREFPSFRVRELYRAAVALAVKDQLDVGLDVVTDGGMHYENETNWELAELFHTLPHHLEGIVPYGDNVVLGTNELAVWKPTVVGDIAWRRPVFKPVLEAVRDATEAPLKINVGIGPVTMAFLCTDKHYGDPKSLAFALAEAYNAEFKDLAARGLEQVQFAEPLTQLAGMMDLEGWMVDALNRCFDGVDLHRVVHLCYGHEQGQPSFEPDYISAQKVFPFAFDIDCDEFHIELASHGFVEVDALKGWPADRDLGVGVIDVKDLRVEAPQDIAAALRRIIDVVPAEQVTVSTDCAIASLRQIVAKNKLASLVEGTRIVRAQLEGSAA